MESDAYKKRVSNLEKISQEMKNLKLEIAKMPKSLENKPVIDDKSKTYLIIQRNKDIDEKELEKLKQKRNRMSLLAML